MTAAVPLARAYFHGTRAALKPGDEIAVGWPSNFKDDAGLSWVYVTGTLDAAIWGAELAKGDAAERVYVVEAQGVVEDDPNVTDKRFAGNPTLSYRSRQPFRVVAEVVGWQGHSMEALDGMKAALARMKAEGTGMIID
ncbi:NAD(+)--rifampin ADP-ribosyltransferase [uncultured Brevundimonas sp.]|uniref:NAD(+)--rifampin ADP-ribosyltransferase n=1 Tax=uncultured Brevundimonas sp. TaxID=213418 RepID=UPI0025DE90B1|nr:NAD(+)--rifampin ADP-ribosyltransferase [uncultured Brevundimonas sp.]